MRQQTAAIGAGLVALAILVLIGLYLVHAISFLMMLALIIIGGGVLFILFLVGVAVYGAREAARGLSARSQRPNRR